MIGKNLPRREFLKQASSIFGAGALAAFAPVHEAFAAQLANLPVPATGPNTFADLRQEYLLSPDVTYFNHGSIGTIPRIVQEARQGYLDLCETDPWLYMWSKPWGEARAHTRENAASFMGCAAEEVVFTHNATEAFNLLAQGLSLLAGDEVVFSSMNHAGASVAWFHYAKATGFSVRKFDFPIHDAPTLTTDDIVTLYRENLTDQTRVLVLPHIDNLVGLRHPVKEIADMARSRGVEFIAVDAAQAVGMIPVNIATLNVDFYATSAHKWLQAPKGVGLLYMRKAAQASVRPMWVTWGQKSWAGSVKIFEDYGTRNLAEVLTLSDAIAFQKRLEEQGALERKRALWEYVRQAVAARPNLTWRSPTQWELASSLYTIGLPGRDSRDVSRDLFQNHGYVFRPFHGDDWNTLRLSLNVFNTEKEIDRFFELLG